MVSQHGVAISPSTYYAHRARPVFGADWDDAQGANAVLYAGRANRSVYGALKLWAEMGRSSIDYLPSLEYERHYRELAATAPTGEVA